MRRRAPAGFTLLEIVLAVALALAAAMLTFYQQAVQVRASLSQEIDKTSAERAIMNLLTTELRGARACRGIGLGMEGALDQVRMVTTCLPGATAWVVTTTTETPPAAERDIQIVGWRLRIVEDEDGQPFIAGIERTCQKNVTARVAEEGKEIQTLLVSSRFKFIRFRYWDGNAWQEAWGGGDLPGAVEIVLGEEPLPEGAAPMDYAGPVFRRVVYVPAGAKTSGGTIVRGLDGGGGP
jgi:type II secretory pathway pseudopilin PulG